MSDTTPQDAEASEIVRFLRKFCYNNFLNQGDREWIESAADRIEVLESALRTRINMELTTHD